MDLHKRKSQSKELFAPIPMRALRDNRLTARHFRVLGSVATYDRLGRNGQGSWAGSKRLAQDSGCSESHLCDALSDLRRFGYIASERHPMNPALRFTGLSMTLPKSGKLHSRTLPV